MSEHRFTNWRGIAAVGLMLAVALVVILNWPKENGEKATRGIASTHSPTVIPVKPLAALDRAALIHAAAIAASDHAAGKTLDPEIEALAGRRFELILPFGCHGAVPPGDELLNGWRFDAETDTLQIAFPSSLQLSPPTAAEDDVDTQKEMRFSKGFWIERDWIRDAICPPDTSKTTGLPVATPTIAIAELAKIDGPRADRRSGEPYRVSKKLPENWTTDGRGFRIVLSGKLAVGESMPLRCVAIAVDRRPVCVILARFDRIAVTDASGSSIYGEWRD